MKKWLKRLLCGEELDRLYNEISVLKMTVDNYQRNNLVLLERVNTPCKTCEDLRQVVNFHVRAAGSKVGIFDGYGPVMPEPKPVEIGKGEEGPMRAALKARLSKSAFIRDQYPQLLRQDAEWERNLEHMAEEAAKQPEENP
jgi:hypothetical protein